MEREAGERSRGYDHEMRLVSDHIGDGAKQGSVGIVGETRIEQLPRGGRLGDVVGVQALSQGRDLLGEYRGRQRASLPACAAAGSDKDDGSAFVRNNDD